MNNAMVKLSLKYGTLHTVAGTHYLGKNPEFTPFINPITGQVHYKKTQKGIPFVKVRT